MNIQITGKRLELSEKFKEHIKESIKSHVTKYFQEAVNAKIVLHKESNIFYADIIVNEGVSHGAFIKTSGHDARAYNAVNDAIMRLSNKLRRYKHKMDDFHKPKKGIKALQKMIQHGTEDGEYLIPNGEVAHNNTPLIAEESTVDIKMLSVAEAVMHMELASVPAMMFINPENNQLSMIYKRQDGNITWVEASNSIEKILHHE